MTNYKSDQGLSIFIGPKLSLAKTNSVQLFLPPIVPDTCAISLYEVNLFITYYGDSHDLWGTLCFSHKHLLRKQNVENLH